jgi:hypothetical protein
MLEIVRKHGRDDPDRARLLENLVNRHTDESKKPDGTPPPQSDV